jgi:hypothetical protein
MSNNVLLILPHSEPYETICSEVLEPEVRAVGLTPVRADRISKSETVSGGISDSISEAVLVIVEATESCSNVFFKFGVAAAHGSECIALARQDKKLYFDARHLCHLLYDPQNLDQLRTDIRKRLRCFSDCVALRSGSLSRLFDGEVCFPDIVDATFLIQTRNSDLRSDIAEHVRSGSPIPSFHIYASDRGTLRWLELCNDPLYDYFHSSLGFLTNYKEKIIGAMGQSFVRKPPDFISLGPGNGLKDRILMTALLGHQTRSKIPKELRYYPYDISLYMLSNAVRTASAQSSNVLPLRIKATCAEFNKLPLFKAVYGNSDVPKLFVILGNTLGNMPNESDFLQQVKSMMCTGDILLVEVRLAGRKVDGPGGSKDLRSRFNFTPLETLGVPYIPEKLLYVREKDRSQVPETITLMAKYLDYEFEGDRIDCTILSYINHYEKHALRELLEQIGFEVLALFPSETAAFYILREP